MQFVTTRLRILVCLASLALFGSVSPAHAEDRAPQFRIVTLKVLLADKPVLEGVTRDIGLTPPDEVWAYWAGIPLEGEIAPDAADKLKATLTGKIKLVAQYGGRAELVELKLVRKDAKQHVWHLAPGEFERIRKLRRN